MTFQQRLMIMTALAGILAAVVLRRKPVAMQTELSVTHDDGLVAAALAIVASALLVVGVVSHTLLRHIIQIAPVVVALGLIAGRSAWGVSAAAPLFAFWLVIMGAIWLFLLGVARIVGGTFTPVEVTLTVVIGAASVLGLVSVRRGGTALALLPRLGTVALFAVLQFAALWLSTQPFAAGW